MDPNDYDRFRVDDRAEVLALLRHSAEARALCSVRAAGRPESYLSPLREVVEDGAPVLDPPRAPVIERALAPGRVAEIDLRLRDGRVSFESRVERIGLSDGRAQLRLEPPATLIRIVKRETFRVRLPSDVPAILTLDGTDRALTGVAMHDLCVQGGSLSLTGVRERFGTGRVFESASLRLPEGPEWPLALRVVHVGLVRRDVDGGEMRVGVQFVRTRAGFETAVAQLVGRIARRAPI
jgi:c-di-GMP-binding flagellar brake protein YcgR